MNKYYLIATNARPWKYRRINLRLRHSNYADMHIWSSNNKKVWILKLSSLIQWGSNRINNIDGG